MENQFDLTELLYRGVLPIDLFWKKDGKGVTSATFKCRSGETGISVDRQANRETEAALAFAKGHLQNGGIVTVTYENICECEAYADPDPTPENPYHTQIYKNAAKEKMSKSQYKHLSDRACIVVGREEP